MWLLHDSGFDPAYEDELQDLIDFATLECHFNSGYAPTTPNSDDLSFVIHSWLSQEFNTREDHPGVPIYAGGRSTIENAIDLEVW